MNFIKKAVHITVPTILTIYSYYYIYLNKEGPEPVFAILFAFANLIIIASIIAAINYLLNLIKQ